MTKNNQPQTNSFAKKTLLLSGTIGEDRESIMLMLGVRDSDANNVSAQTTITGLSETIEELLGDLEINHAQSLAAEEAKRKKRKKGGRSKNRSAKKKSTGPLPTNVETAKDIELADEDITSEDEADQTKTEESSITQKESASSNISEIKEITNAESSVGAKEDNVEQPEETSIPEEQEDFFSEIDI